MRILEKKLLFKDSTKTMIITTLILDNFEKDISIMENGDVYLRSVNDKELITKLTPEDCYKIIQGITKVLKELEK